MISLKKSITMFFCLLLLLKVTQAQVIFTEASPYLVRSIEGNATWTMDTTSGDFIYYNSDTASTHRAIVYSKDAFQSEVGFKLTVEYTTGSIGDDGGHNFSFGLIRDDADIADYSGFNPFRATPTVYSIGANLTTNETTTARGLNFANGTKSVTLDVSGTSAQFVAAKTTKVTIEIGIGGYWSYRINDVYENSGVLLEGFDLAKSYHVAIYGQDDNGGGKSIQSIELKKRYAAGERAKKLRGTWNSDIYPTLIDERVTHLKTLDCFGVSFTDGAVLSAEHKAPHKLLESIEGSETVVPAWGNLNFEYPEKDEVLDHIKIIRSAGFRVKAYTNSENFVGSNATQFEVFVKNWMTYCDTNKVVQAFIDSQPFHTGIWNSTTQKYEDASAKYPFRKYMFCYAEFVLKDYALRYGEYIDNWIFDDGGTMDDNGDNATSGLIEEQRIYQAFANAVHAGNPEIPIAFNNGRSTVNYESYPFAHSIQFEDFTFGHAFGGNNNHAEKVDGNQFSLNYQHITRMTETNGYVHAGGNWTWDDLIVGNFHSKLATTAWKYGPVQAWEQADFNQWNLEAMQAGGSMTWGGSFNRTYTAVYDWVYVLLDSLDAHLAKYESPGAPNWARAYTVLPDATVGKAYAHNLVEDLDFWDPEGDEITELLVVPEDDAPSWLSISETKLGTWTLSGTPDETATKTYDFRLRVKDATGQNDRMVHLKVIDPNAIISVKALNISSEKLDLFVGKTFQLTTEVLPLDATKQVVSWSSNNLSVAKVNASGLVTALDTGVVIVTATTLDGSFSKSCKIQVSIAEKEKCTSANIALCGFATQSSTDYSGEASRAIDGNTDGNFANNSVTHTLEEANPWWKVNLGLEYTIGDIIIYNRAGKNNVRLSNFTVSVYNAHNLEVFSKSYTTYPDPSVTCNAGGVAGQTVIIQQNATIPLSLAEVEVFEYVADTTTTGIHETKSGDTNLVLFPNPATKILNYNFGSLEGVNSIAVYSVLGQRMLVQAIKKSIGQIDISQLQNGIYFFKILGNETLVARFIKE